VKIGRGGTVDSSRRWYGELGTVELVEPGYVMVDENSGLARVHRTKPSGTVKPILGWDETSVNRDWCDVLQKYLPIPWHAGRCRRRPRPRSYCDDVDATPSRGRLRHMEHSLYG
jgi:hypothetical protein